MSEISSSSDRRSFLVSSAAIGVSGLLATEAHAAADTAAIRPFRINVPEEQLANLRRRVKATRWPEQEDAMA